MAPSMAAVGNINALTRCPFRLRNAAMLLEQQRHAPDRKRPEQHLPVGEPKRQDDRGLALKCRRPPHRAQPREDARTRILAGDPSEPGDDPVERIDSCADAALRRDAVEIERAHEAFETDDRDLDLPVEAAAGGETERAGAHRDGIALLYARPADLDPATARLQFAKPYRPRFRREIG